MPEIVNLTQTINMAEGFARKGPKARILQEIERIGKLNEEDLKRISHKMVGHGDFRTVPLRVTDFNCRLLFSKSGAGIKVHGIGSHDDIERLLKNLR